MGGKQDEGKQPRPNRREQQKAGRSRRKGADALASFTEQDPVPMLAAIFVASESSGAIRLGLTRDGGAFAVGCYAGEDYATEYIKPNEVWADAWYDIVEAWWPAGLERFQEICQLGAQAAR